MINHRRLNPFSFFYNNFVFIDKRARGDFKSKIEKFEELFSELQFEIFIAVCLGEVSMTLLIIPFSKMTAWYIEYFHWLSTMNLYW